MIDVKSIEDLVKQQITDTVEKQIRAVMSDPVWLSEIENKIVSHVQDRITAKFANISTVPDLVDTVKMSVKNLLDQGHLPDISGFVDVNKVKQHVDVAFESLVNKTLDNLAIDPDWVQKIEKNINHIYSNKISESISLIDINSALVDHIDSALDRWVSKKKNFSTKGIKDQADDLEITVMPQAVVIENELITKKLSVIESAQVNGTLIVDDLILKNSVNTDNKSWLELATKIATETLKQINDDWKDQLVSQVLDIARGSGIDFKDISIAGSPIVEGDRLTDRISKTKITELGILKNLEVAGETRIFDTVHVNKNRLGINTERPDMALSVWDEEVTMSIGKLGEKKAFVGTSRLQNFSLGVNRTAYIEINTDGLTTIKDLRVGKHRIGHSENVPGYAGARGDIVFNSNPREGTPFAWVCLGEYRWQSLKSA